MIGDRLVASGAAVPILSDTHVSQNTRTGTQTDFTYEGLYAECYNMRIDLERSGASNIDLRPKHDGNWLLTATISGDENGFERVNTPSVHELEVDVMMPSIFQNPRWQAVATAKCGAAAASRIAQTVGEVVRDYQSNIYPIKISTAIPPPAGFYNPGQGAKAAEDDLAIKLAANSDTITSNMTWAQAFAVRLFRLPTSWGQEAYLEERNVYRRTITAATPFQVRASNIGAGQIWTTQEVAMFEGINFAGFFALDPASLWRKGRPQVIATVAQKTQIIYTYTQAIQASATQYQAYRSAVLIDADVMA